MGTIEGGGRRYEIKIDKYPNPVTIKNIEKILRQMKESICKIFREDSGKASGFFCKIPLGTRIIHTLITNYHVIDESYVKSHNMIKISLYDDKINKTIYLDDDRIKYFSENYDIAIIEIKNKDEINTQFLELDEDIFEKDQIYFKNLSIYNISYPKSELASVSFGLLKKIDNYTIKHFCSTEEGSSGSPIFNLSNNKVIGLHNAGSNTLKCNSGIFLKYPINEFKKKYEAYEYYYDSIFIEDYENNGKQTYDISGSIPMNNICGTHPKYNHQNINNFYEYGNSYYSTYNTSYNSINSFNYNNHNNQDKISNNFHNNLIAQDMDLYRNFNRKEEQKVNKNEAKENKITLKLNIDKNDLKKEVYFLNNTSQLDKYLNDSNIKLYINGKKEKFRKYLKAEEQQYSVVLKFPHRMKDCSKMFMDCYNIVDIDLSSFNAENVVNMSYMFTNCRNLTNINLSSLNTEKVANMEYMFCNCNNLHALDLSSFNTKSVINMHEMFANCRNLSEIHFSSLFDTKIVNDMKYIFTGCKNLNSLTFNGQRNERLSNELINK